MALPSAQLGSMPSLSLPSAVPVQQVEKRTPLWQQLLGQILLQTAGGVVGQGVQNTMSRDFAGDYPGETPAGGVDKFFHGPKVTGAEDVRRKGQAFDTDKLLAQGRLNIGMQELNDQPGAREVYARQTAESAASDRRQADMTDTISKSKLSRREQGHADEREIAHELFASELERSRQQAASDLEGKRILAEQPFQTTRMANMATQTQGQSMTNQLLQRALTGGAASGAATPKPGMAAMAGGSAVPTPETAAAVVAPPQLSDQTTIQQLLASGIPPEEIIARLQQEKLQEEMTRQGEETSRMMGNQQFRSREDKFNQIMKALNGSFLTPQQQAESMMPVN